LTRIFVKGGCAGPRRVDELANVRTVDALTFPTSLPASRHDDRGDHELMVVAEAVDAASQKVEHLRLEPQVPPVATQHDTADVQLAVFDT